MAKNKKSVLNHHEHPLADPKKRNWLIATFALISIILAVVLAFSAFPIKKSAQPPVSQSGATPNNGAASNLASVAPETSQNNLQANQTKPGAEDTKQVTIKTTKGDILLEVYPKLMPVTVGNFDKLIKAKFYDGLTFHRVEDWVIQGGDPQGNGRGGPGWTIPLETNPQLKNVRGAVAMARSNDPNSAGSQFYILKKDAAWLDGQYAVFGRVVKGMEIVDKLTVGDQMSSVR